MMGRAWLKLTMTELRLFFRLPIAAFFTIAFPLMLLVVTGSIFGNAPQPGSDLGAVDLTTPAYFAMIVGTVGLLTVPGWVATYRERGVFRRFQVTPVSPAALLAAQGTVGAIAALAGASLLVIAGRVVFRLHWPAAPFSLLLGMLLSLGAMISLGFVIAAAAKDARTAQAIGMICYFPMLFLSGAAFPRQLMPPGVRRLSELIPLSHVTDLLSGLWFDARWTPSSVLVLSGLTVASIAVGARLFRWE